MSEDLSKKLRNIYWKLGDLGQILAPSHSPELPPKAQAQKLYEQLSLRRSIRSYSKRPVDREVVTCAIRTAGTAPSGANTQPWFFAMVESPEIKKKIREEAEREEKAFYGLKAPYHWLRKIAPLKTDENKACFEDAGVIIVVFSRVASDDSDEKTYYPLESTCIATGILLTTLHLSGLSTLVQTTKPMKFINQILHLDSTYRPHMMVLVGYKNEDTLVPNLTRKPLSEIMKAY